MHSTLYIYYNINLHSSVPTFGLEEEASMIILSPTLIPRLAMVTSSTRGDWVLEDCFTVAMPLGEGAVHTRKRERERDEERERE